MLSVKCSKPGKALVCPSTIAQTDKSRLEMPELGCQEMPGLEFQEMPCRMFLEAQYKNKMQLTSHTEPILEIRSSAKRYVFIQTEGVRQSVRCGTAKRE